MKSIHEVASKRYSYSKRGSKDPSIAIEENLSREEEDKILDSYPELISPNFRGWFVQNHLRRLGSREFIKRADHAMRYGKHKQKFFVYLLS